MLSSRDDYIFKVPSASDDISGDIIPVADMAGRLVNFRREDVAYLLEMLSLWYNDNLNQSWMNPTDIAGIKSCLSSIYSYCKSEDNNNYITNRKLFRSGQYPFEGQVGTATDQFWNYARNNVVKFGNKSMSVKGDRFDADVLRYLYWFFNQDVYRNVGSVTRSGISDALKTYQYEVTPTQIPYKAARLESMYEPDNEITYTDITGSIEPSGYNIVCNGISANGLQVGLVSFKRWNTQKLKYEYYYAVNFPTQDVIAEIEFERNVSDVFAVIVYTYQGSRSKRKELSVKMNGSGKKFSVQLLKRDVLSEFLESDGVDESQLNKWIETDLGYGGKYFNCSIDRVFAKFASPHTKLPSGWTWQPS